MNNHRVNVIEAFHKTSYIVLIVAASISTVFLACIYWFVIFPKKDVFDDILFASVFIGVFILMIFLVLIEYRRYKYYRDVKLKYIQTVNIIKTERKDNQNNTFKLHFIAEKDFIEQECSTGFVLYAKGDKKTRIENYVDGPIEVGYNPDKDEWIPLVKKELL